MGFSRRYSAVKPLEELLDVLIRQAIQKNIFHNTFSVVDISRRGTRAFYLVVACEGFTLYFGLEGPNSLTTILGHV